MRLIPFVQIMTILLLIGSGQALAGKLGAKKLSAKTTDLLAGRLTIRLPEKARIEPRQASIMAAAQAAEEETRVVLDAARTVPYRFVVTTLDICTKHEFSSVSFAVPKKSGQSLP